MINCLAISMKHTCTGNPYHDMSLSNGAWPGHPYD